jgi:hypothetical protein
MCESLLELSPGSPSRSLALTRSDRGGARLGARPVSGLEAGDEVESGAWVFAGYEPGRSEPGRSELGGVELGGAELAGAGFCAHAPRLYTNKKITTKLRIRLFYRP